MSATTSQTLPSSDLGPSASLEKRNSSISNSPSISESDKQGHNGPPSPWRSPCSLHEESQGQREQHDSSTSGKSTSPPPEETKALNEIDEAVDHVNGWALLLLITSLCLAVLLVSLDRTIITTAIPYITQEFQSTEDIGWYGSAYLLTACAFQPLFGRIYGLFSVKWSYVISTFIFGIGSLLCAVAPNTVVFIVGRAIAGFGSAGILTGSFVVVAVALPLQKRPIYTAIVGIMFGLGATLGPVLGGVFTDLVTWRWCFYLNLPVAGAAIIAFILFFRPKRKVIQHDLSWAQKIFALDLVGTALLLGAVIMLFLALEEAVAGKAWDSSRIIGLLCGFGVTAIVFILWLWYKKDSALIPPSIVCQRTVAASCIMAFMVYAALLMQTYFLPLWFQAVLARSALRSGIDMIPFFIVNAFASLVAGIFVSVIGYFVPPCLVGNAIATVGSGLLTILSPDTTTAQWAGFEIVIAVGFGLSLQQGFTAVQTVLPLDEIPIGTAAVVACQSLGGAIFVSVGNSIFQECWRGAFRDHAIPQMNLQNVIAQGATAFREIVPRDLLPIFIKIYNNALRQVFYAAIPLAGIASCVSFLLEWKSVKQKPQAARP